MSKFLSKAVGIFKYKEPANKELGFELLEDANEGNENAGNPQDNTAPQPPQPPQNAGPQPPQNAEPQPPQNAEPQPPPRKRAFKTPIAADQWKDRKKSESAPPADPNLISGDLKTSIETMRQKFQMSVNTDVVAREFNIGRKVNACIVFIEGLVDKKLMDLALLPLLMDKDVFKDGTHSCPVDYLIQNVISMHQIKKTSLYHEAVTIVLAGGGALFIEGCGECILIQMAGAERRSVSTPKTEPTISGSQEALTECMDTNVALIRRIIKNENLMVEYLPVGNTNHSYCAVIYIKGIANQSVVAEVIKRIKKIDTSFIAGGSFIEQFIEDNPYMLLPQMISTERPDRTAFFINEGMVAVIGDGSPAAVAAPCTFFRLLHSAEDRYLRWPFATFLRLIRYVGLFFALFLPGVYLALTMFHIEIVPTELLVSIAKAKEMVPFPSIIELLILEIAFELIREGAVRVPGVIGQTLGIVGALILGQAAVAANLISPIMVIIVSITAISSFTIPNYELSIAVRILRFALLLGGASFGFYGITAVTAILLLLAVSMKSFGVPYFAPVAPKTKPDTNTILSHPVFSRDERMDAFNSPDKKAQGANVKNWTKKQPAKPGGGGA